MISSTGNAPPPSAPSGPATDLMLTVNEARERILAHFSPLPSEQVPILDALGRVLAEDVIAPNDVPPLRQLGHGRLRGTGRRPRGCPR